MTDKIEVILVDIGSSIIKSVEVTNGEFKNQRTWETIQQLKGNYKEIPFAISTVRNNQSELKSLFDGSNSMVLDHTCKLPIKLDYETPETLGADRIALAVGATELFPNENNLVIDLGTCATLDLVDSSKVFHGGIIAPGLMMRMKAMSTFTQSLPDISEEWQELGSLEIGKSTKQSLLAGSFNGLLKEINSTIKTFEQDFASINIILTGGDAKFFESRLKAHIFAGSKIVEIGLYRIWKHQ